MRRIWIIASVIFVLMQFYRPQKNLAINGTEEYETIAQKLSLSPSLNQLFINACYDCHSNNTRYEWYHNIAPVSYLVAHDVKEGKEHLNFSILDELPYDKQAHAYEEIVEVVESHEMPMQIYQLMHKKAKLTDEQRDEIITWAKQKEKEAQSMEQKEAKELDFDE